MSVDVLVENRTNEETRVGNRALPKASPILFALLVIYCFGGALTVIVDSAGLLHNPWENTYPESSQTYAAIYAAQTGKLYIPPMSQAPYTPQPFAPLYYVVNAGIAKLAHLDVDLFIFYARLAAYIAYLLCGVMVFLICEAAAIPLLYAGLAALMMLGHPDFLGQNASPRPDMFYLLAMLVSLYCAVKWGNDVWRGYGLAGIFAGIAFLVKQPGAAVAIAIFAVLLLQREFKSAAILCLGSIVAVSITTAVLYWRGDYFLQQMAFAGKSLWSMQDGANYVAKHLLVGHWIVPIGIGAIGFIRAMHLGTRSRMIASFALINWMVGLFGIGQNGGYLNYFLPGLAGCALLLPYAIQLFKERVTMKAFVVVVAAALLWATTDAFSYEAIQSKYFPAPTTDSLAWLHPYRVLADLSTIMMHGREPMFLDPQTNHVMELTRNWDPAPLLQSLAREDFDLIILTRVSWGHFVPSYRGVSLFSAEEVRLMNEKYQILCSTNRSMVLTPRGREVSATPAMFTQMFRMPCSPYPRAEAADLSLEPGVR